MRFNLLHKRIKNEHNSVETLKLIKKKSDFIVSFYCRHNYIFFLFLEVAAIGESKGDQSANEMQSCTKRSTLSLSLSLLLWFSVVTTSMF